MGLIFESYLYDTLFLIVSIITLLTYDAFRRLNYFEDRGIPYVKTTLTQLFKSFALKTDINVGFDTIYKNFPNDACVGYFQVLRPAFVVREPELILKILIKDFNYFNDHGLPADIKTNPLLGSLFNLKGEEWKVLRHKLAPTFTSSKLKWMFPLMNDCADRLMKEIADTTNESKDISAKDLFATFSLDVIASCAFGLEGENIKDPDCNFRKHIESSLMPTSSSMLDLFLRSTMPGLFRFFRIKGASKDIEDFIMSLTKQTFDYRKKSGTARRDFIQLLLELKEQGSIKYDDKELEHDEKDLFGVSADEIARNKHTLELTDELLAAQIYVFCVAGYENTSFTIAFTSYFLAKNKDIQERVRKEINEKKKQLGEINFDTVKELKLLDACISESLRLHPPVPFLMRKCIKSYQMDNGCVIEKGKSLIIPSISLQRDPKYWERPDDFYPERFLNSSSATKGVYLPFGDGPRICIALKFAKLQSALMLAKVLEKFEILPSQRTQEPLKFTTFFTSNVIGGLWIKLKPIPCSTD